MIRYYDWKTMIIVTVGSVLLCSMCSQPSFATKTTKISSSPQYQLAEIWKQTKRAKFEQTTQKMPEFAELTAILETEKLKVSFAEPYFLLLWFKQKTLYSEALVKGSGKRAHRVKKIIRTRLKQENSVSYSWPLMALIIVICGLSEVKLNVETLKKLVINRLFFVPARVISGDFCLDLRAEK